ncbi:TPA: Com family DNA-binding transcriptional regulator [Citrobacter freundii]
MPQNVRCKHCNKLLARASFLYIEVKCPRCKKLNQITSSAIEHPTFLRSYTRGDQHATPTSQQT